MKKYIFKLLFAAGICGAVCTLSAFAANTVTINSVSISEYTDSTGAVDDDYVTATVGYTATPDSSSEEMSRITFALTAQDLQGKLAGNEAKVIYLDEALTPQKESYSFVIEKERIRSALSAASGTEKEIGDIEGSNLTFVMGGVGVEEEATFKVTYYSPKDALYGDVDGNGKIRSTDAILVLKYDAGLEELTDEQKKLADVDGNGKIRSTDAIMILKYDAGLITEDDIANTRKENALN
ncbi:MAG: dockerin type I repeat-containing protein [Clostridia bacterium]|nr:dockerin type I repeat-containing protein [Clostridia bacterium]